MNPELIEIEGYGYVNPETGELVGEACPDAETMTADEVQDTLYRLWALEADLLGREARLKAELSAVERNLKPKVNALKRAREWFLGRITHALERYAKAVLDGQNSEREGKEPLRSLKFARGTLGFRAVNEPRFTFPKDAQGAIDALQWLGEHCPQAIVYEPTYMPSGLDDDMRDTIRAVEAGELTWQEAGWSGPCPLKVTLPGDVFYVRTGLKEVKE